jgi:hypothetical protein
LRRRLILFKSSDIYPCDVFERNIEQQNGPLAAAHFDILSLFSPSRFLSSTENVFGRKKQEFKFKK